MLKAGAIAIPPFISSIGATRCLDIQVADVLGVFLDEFASRRDFGAHEDAEEVVGLSGIVDCDLQQSSGFGIHGSFPELIGVHFTETFVALDGDADLRHCFANLVLFFLAVGILFVLAVLELVERRLRDIDVARFDHGFHVSEEEGEDQGADVGAVDVGVGHDDDLVVAQAADIEFVADAAAEGGDDRPDFVVGEDAVDAGFFDVEDFTAQRQDCLEASVAALFGGAAGGVTLDDVDFAGFRIAQGAVGELAGHGSRIEHAFAPGEFLGFAGRLASGGGLYDFLDDLFGNRRVFFEI